MKYLLTILLIFHVCVFGENQISEYSLIINDGQFYSAPFTVFVPDLSLKDVNKVELLLINSVKNDLFGSADSTVCFKPKYYAENQIRTIIIEEKDIAKTGTLFIFSIKNLKIPFYKAAGRYVPILKVTYNNNVKDSVASTVKLIISDKNIYIANQIGAFLISFVLCFLVVSFIYVLIKLSGKSFFQLFTVFGCKSSLSLTQLGLWTISAGYIILAYGLTRQEIPEIPITLISLIGLSIFTSAFGYNQSQQKAEITKSNGISNSTDTMVSDIKSLVSIEINGKLYPSIAKAQYLFWTLLTIILFVYKSIVEGVIWNIPEELVFLMGLSQGSFLYRNHQELKKENK